MFNLSSFPEGFSSAEVQFLEGLRKFDQNKDRGACLKEMDQALQQMLPRKEEFSIDLALFFSYPLLEGSPELAWEVIEKYKTIFIRYAQRSLLEKKESCSDWVPQHRSKSTGKYVDVHRPTQALADALALKMKESSLKIGAPAFALGATLLKSVWGGVQGALAAGVVQGTYSIYSFYQRLEEEEILHSEEVELPQSPPSPTISIASSTSSEAVPSSSPEPYLVSPDRGRKKQF